MSTEMEDGKNETEETQDGEKKQVSSWDAWYATLSTEQQELLNSHVTGLKNTVTALRNEVKEAKPKLAKLSEMEQAAQAKADAEKTELERLQGQLTTLQQQANQAAQQLEHERYVNAVTAAAHTLLFNDPADALALLDSSKIEKGNDGKYVGIEAALKELIKGKPYLVRVEGKGDGKGNPPRGGGPLPKKAEPAKPNITF